MKKPISLYHKILGNKKLQALKMLQALALAEMREMKQNREYAKKVRFVENCPSLLCAFKWSNTTGGSFDTWKLVYNIIMSK